MYFVRAAKPAPGKRRGAGRGDRSEGEKNEDSQAAHKDGRRRWFSLHNGAACLILRLGELAALALRFFDRQLNSESRNDLFPRFCNSFPLRNFLDLGSCSAKEPRLKISRKSEPETFAKRRTRILRKTPGVGSRIKASRYTPRKVSLKYCILLNIVS